MAPPTLADWHDRLTEHFAELRAERDLVRPGSPLFALEHGLSLDGDLPELQEAVRRTVSGASLPPKLGLPFVVYAAEVGYGYRGEEFWPVFEEATPRWRDHGIEPARRFIRQRFEEFADAFGGARISGRWALWFKNIAWPITHAVLPTDLQRHLARLLYDYRGALTTELLDDHDLLGKRLAERSHDTSARFRKFAENTELLGLVAASLLVGEEEETPLLTREVLLRIVADLNDERQAGAWLIDAKRAAVRVRRKGLIPSGTPSARPSAQTRDQQGTRVDVALSLRRSPEGWRAYVLIPSHRSLVSRFPDLVEVFERSRYRIDGVGTPQPLGALMYDRGPLPLTSWPTADGQSLVHLDADANLASQVLADHCRLPSGPWLFRVTEQGLATEVRTRIVRPGGDYILLSRNAPLLDALNYTSLELLTTGVGAGAFRVPDPIDQSAIDQLLAAGLSVGPDFEAWPAGVVPAAWDREGSATWPAGENPTIAIRTSRAVARCVVSSDLEVREFAWPVGMDTVFVQLTGLPPSELALEIALLQDSGDCVAQGRFGIRIDEPVDSSMVAGSRQGIQVRTYPPHPTLYELWTGSAFVEVTGPTGERISFEVSLHDQNGKPTYRASFSSLLPLDSSRWRELLRGATSGPTVDEALGEAEALVVRVENADLGSSEVRAERPFEPLRWVTGNDNSGPFARLVNHTAERPSIEYYAPDHPATALSLEVEDEQARVRLERGGLLVARAGELRATAVISPHIHGGLEALKLLAVRPVLQTGPRTPESVRRCVELAVLWGRAMSADASATQLQVRVLEAIQARLGGLIGGQYWWDVELAVIDGKEPTDTLLASGLGRRADERAVGLRLLHVASAAACRPNELTETFISSLVSSRWALRTQSAVMLQIAGSPERVDLDDSTVDAAIRLALEQPLLFRLARLSVLAARGLKHENGVTE